MTESDGRFEAESPERGVLDEGELDSGHPGYGRSAVREQTEKLKQRARATGAEAKEAAQERIDALKEQAGRRTDELTSQVGGRIAVLARALRRAGEEMRSEGETRFADLSDDAADQVERIGSYLDGQRPGEMLTDLERTARSNPAFFLGGTFAVGMLLGRFLRAGDPGPQVVFEPEGDWGMDGNGSGPGGDGSGRAQYGFTPGTDGDGGGPRGLAEPDVEAAVTPERVRPERAMTPDIENISAEHPASPAPGGARERYSDETPVHTPIAGHESAGPGVRTGSSGAAALDAGSGGPVEGAYDPRSNRAEPPAEGER